MGGERSVSSIHHRLWVRALFQSWGALRGFRQEGREAVEVSAVGRGRERKLGWKVVEDFAAHLGALSQSPGLPQYFISYLGRNGSFGCELPTPYLFSGSVQHPSSPDPCPSLKGRPTMDCLRSEASPLFHPCISFFSSLLEPSQSITR